MCGARYTEDPNIAESFLMSTEEWAVESFTDAAAGGVGGAGPLQGDFCDNYITILGGFTASSLTQESSGYVTTEAAITTTEAATTTTEAATKQQKQLQQQRQSQQQQRLQSQLQRQAQQQ